MAPPEKHKWIFRARFRRQAFGWRSQPARKRIREAVTEIRRVSRKDPILGGEGAVIFIEKLSPALGRIDSSSGAIGRAVNNAIGALVPIISEAPADDKLRGIWLDRLFEAIQEDNMPYIEYLGDFWGDLCATPGIASQWADELAGTVRLMWSGRFPPGGYFSGTSACFSALLKAGRYDDLLNLLKLDPHPGWYERQWGAKALAAQGFISEAIHYAEDSIGLNVYPSTIAGTCEELLLSVGRIEEAYEKYGILANRRSTNLAAFRAVAKKYPHKEARAIIRDLALSTPGEEGKWFAAAKSAGLYELAIELANQSPCDPRTLTRAARDFSESEPDFAVAAGITALRWMVEGYVYEITGIDVQQAYNHTMKAAEHAGSKERTLGIIRVLVANETHGKRFVTEILDRELGLKWSD
ncbi:MAG: hypothetical protein BMS9Abin05_2502 [Rhodothermia bacterium]|nr:MAG: hypothetical protein BMS9Abin05_2502 [Rhodothermia bacterium]